MLSFASTIILSTETQNASQLKKDFQMKTNTLHTALTKGLLSLVAISVLSSSASAGSFINEKALHSLTANVGYSGVDIDGKSTSGVNLGFGMAYYTQSVMFGWDYQFVALSDGYGEDSAIGNVDAILGYRVTPALTPYLLAGATSIGALTGFAYGGGVKYQFIDYVALDVRFSHANLINVGIDVPTNQLTAGVEFNFRTSK